MDEEKIKKYASVANTGLDILGDFMYDTNDYALNFNYRPILPGIGNRDAILNNNIRYRYLPMQDVGAGEWVGDTLSNGLSVGLLTGNVWAGLGAAAATLIGKGVKLANINQENNLGYTLADSANKQQNAINNYALEQTDKYNTFMQMRHMAEGGGNLNTHGATFDNGMTYFNVGGTHEQNPYGGILQGFNEEDGEPNLVEQGETKWNDYIFSNRYKAGGSLLKKYLLPEEYAGMTFADISKKLSEPLEDTPGSMIEKRTTDTMLGRLMEALEEKREKDAENQVKNIFAKGGPKKHNSKQILPIYNPITDVYIPETGGIQDEYILELPLGKTQRVLSDEQKLNIKPYTIGVFNKYNDTPLFLEDDSPMNRYTASINNNVISSNIDTHPVGTIIEGTPTQSQKKSNRGNFSMRDLILADNFFSVLSDKLGWTNQPDYGRSRMIRDAAGNIRDASIITPYLLRYIPRELPIQSLMNNYRSMLAADIARANNTTNANIVAAQALANNATNKYYDSLGQALINATQYNNQENAQATELNNASELQLAQLLQNNSQFNAQQGIHRYSALRDYINDLSAQDQLASAAQQGDLNTWREGLQNYLIEREDKDVIAQLIKSGALKYDRNAGAYYLDRYLV